MKRPERNASKIEKKPLDVLVHQRLRQEILSGERTAGSRLIQDDLARDLGVSRIPVRDALRMLEGEGLIDRVGVGYAVAETNERGLADLFGLRLRIDGFAAGLCARRATPELIAELERILQSCSVAVAANDVATFAQLDIEFHETIYQGANSPQLRKCVFLLWNGTPPIASMKSHPKRLEQAHQEHQSIVTAIRAGDYLNAEEQARIHVDRARSALLSHAPGEFNIYP